MKQLLPIILLALAASCRTPNVAGSPSGPRQDVTGYEGKFFLHPDSVIVQTDRAAIYCLFDFPNKVMYLTDHDYVYQEVSDFLPTRVIVGRLVVVQGTEINPFTVMTQSQFQQVTERMRQKGIELNGYKVAWLMNYGLYEADGSQTRFAPQKIADPNPLSRPRPRAGGFH